MRFHSYDALRLFDVAARRMSLTAAAEELNVTKGAVSYRIRRLEADLGFALFDRGPRGVTLTPRGQRLRQAARAAFESLDREIEELRDGDAGRITVGLATYVASRWLSPRLMTFISAHPRIGLRLQPMTDLTDLRAAGIDMAIRWGKGDWTDARIEPLLPCPAFPVGGAGVASLVAREGLAAVLPEVPLLHDRDDSTAWEEWHRAAGLAYRPARRALVIPDPNVRVQAVIDGQGIALNDALVAPEIAAGLLHPVSEVRLEDYGYFLAYPPGALADPALAAFRDWIVGEACAGR